ncbi:transcriptional repressor [uncultured Shimia sp.]|uniref:transcriptional repressor n=1 Tax=uncultured Shimia sp. TaxID=573152 RepID=UPI002609FA82|nr:transcriptional repressor [uncultured Shimia sp.]
MHDIGFESHDHEACVVEALKTAETCCAERQAQLTPVRRRVLEILLQEHRAMGAYDILAQLAQEGLGSQPPVAYRALDFLEKQGLVHKIERLNAWLACSHAGSEHSPLFLICRECGAVAESAIPRIGLRKAAEDVGFLIETTVVEAEGLCPICQKAA